MTTAQDIERLKIVRASSRFLVAIGACATAGGIQGLRNFAAVDDYVATVYANPSYIETLATSTPVSAHVPVDFELRGCPIDRYQLLEVLTAYLAGRAPRIPSTRSARTAKRPQRMRHGGRRHPVPRAGDQGRVRRRLPSRRAGLLRVLRAAGHCQHHFASAAPVRSRRHAGRTGADVPDLYGRCTRVRKGEPLDMTIAATVPSRSGRWPASKAKAGCRVVVTNGAVSEVALNIFEPPRFFEAFLTGRHYTEVPDITARICGICPVAYQMSACAAIESAFGVRVGDQISDLRRLLYCGEWLQSHALHVHFLHAPDFFGCQRRR